MSQHRFGAAEIIKLLMLASESTGDLPQRSSTLDKADEFLIKHFIMQPICKCNEGIKEANQEVLLIAGVLIS